MPDIAGSVPNGIEIEARDRGFFRAGSAKQQHRYTGGVAAEDGKVEPVQAFVHAERERIAARASDRGAHGLPPVLAASAAGRGIATVASRPTLPIPRSPGLNIATRMFHRPFNSALQSKTAMFANVSGLCSLHTRRRHGLTRIKDSR